MPYKNILTEQSGVIFKIVINRPENLNALNKETIAELSGAFKEADLRKDINVIILTGSGEKAFVAGADIKEFYQFNVEQGKQLSEEGHQQLFNLVENLSKPVIAAINGFALGGGLELAMSCHIRLASDNAKLGLPEVSLGIIPGYGGTQRLAQIAGKGMAMEMITSAKMISAQRAMDCGLVNDVTTQDELLSAAEKLAGKIAQNSPLAIASAIKAINSGYQKNVNGFEKEIEEFGKCFGTEDFKEGTAAFMEKRKATFPGA